MAKRLYFVAKPSYQGLIVEKTIEFENFRGETLSQKHKSIDAMHHAIRAFEGGGNILEVSPVSPVDIGRRLSGINLMCLTKEGDSYPLMNIFESAKVFEHGGPYMDLLSADPYSVSEDPRLRSSGRLLGFYFEDQPYGLMPRNLFFDYIYIQALNAHKELHEEILRQEMITDIEYHMGSMFASSARACAYFISLTKVGLLEESLKSLESFQKIYSMVF